MLGQGLDVSQTSGGSVVPGILTDAAKSGPLGGNLSMNGIPVTLSLGPNPDGSADTQFSHVTIKAGQAV
jgi:hypothetical protein